MSQFYFRFIRYTSTEYKDVYFITYAGSIESNLMQMILVKEKLNLFMKGQDTNLDEIYERFDVDYDLLALLMYQEEDDRDGCGFAGETGHCMIYKETEVFSTNMDTHY